MRRVEFVPHSPRSLMADLMYAPVIDAVRLGENPQHAEQMRGLVGDLAPEDFTRQGLDGKIASNYSDVEKGARRIENLKASARRIVPTASYLMSEVGSNSDWPLGVVSFACEDTESYRFNGAVAKVLGKLNVNVREGGLRYFTGWLRSDDATIASAVMHEGIDLGALAGLNELKTITRPKNDLSVNSPISAIEEVVDIQSFGFTGGQRGRAIIEGQPYEGFIFSKELR